MPVACVAWMQQVVDAPVVVGIREAGERLVGDQQALEVVASPRAVASRSLGRLGRPTRRKAAASVVSVW